MRFKCPGSNGGIYPWSPPRVGVDIKVLQRLYNALFQKLHDAINEEGMYFLPWPTSDAYRGSLLSPLDICELYVF
jgi:hypothetical protein